MPQKHDYEHKIFNPGGTTSFAKEINLTDLLKIMLWVNPTWVAVSCSQARSKPMQGSENRHASKENNDALCCEAPCIPRSCHPRDTEELERRNDQLAWQTLSLS
jgi:hypothetical protein